MNPIIKIEVVKALGGDTGTNTWRNTYHIELTDAMVAGDPDGPGIESLLFKNAAIAILQGETNLHLPGVIVERAVCSTPEPGDNAIPDSLRVIPWGRPGARPGNQNAKMLPLNNVLKVGFAAIVGRVGTNQYRGAVYTDDVVVSGGGYSIVPGIDQLLHDSLVGPWTAGGLNDRFRIVKFVNGVLVARPVTLINVLGMGNRQRTQKKRPKLPTTAHALLERLQELAAEYVLLTAATAVFDPALPAFVAILPALRAAYGKFGAPPALPPAP